ncbi:MAG: TolC family protein [Cytophagales bacterium]|nr:TolC family protein [Cytophagales bacterium]
MGLNAQVMRLDTLLSAIEKNNPELQMYDAQVKALNSYAKGAKSWEAPQVSAGLWMTPYNAKLWKPDANSYISPLGMGQFMVSGIQMIPNFKQQNANQKYMNQMASVENAKKGFNQNQLFFEAKMNYYEWLVLKKKLAVLMENEKLLNFIIKATEVRYPYNQEKLGSIYKAKASLMSLNNEKIMLQNDIDQKMISLNTLLNRDKNTVFDIDTSYTLQKYESTSFDTSSIVSQRSDIHALEQSIMVSKYKREAELSKGRLTYGVRFDHMQGFGYQPNLFSIMGMVNIPLVPWAAKEYKANSVGLQYDIMAMEKQKETILNQTSGMLQTISKQIANKKRQLELYQKGIIPTLQKNYKASLLAYEQNTEDLFVVLDAQQNLQMTQIEYLNQLQEVLLLQVQYEKEIEKQ